MAVQDSDQLIRTKLRLPFIRPGVVSRPRLQDQVTQGLHGSLVLVTAPAGFGKTTLVGSCVVACGMPVAWLSLDQNDNRTGRFLNYLIAAVNGVDQSIGVEAAQLLAASPQTPIETILTSIINDLDIAGEDLVLVLDDYHLISSAPAHEAMSLLLDHQPQSLHLVVITRSDPPLPLSRLRARAQLVELRAADLRFTPSEAAEFLNDAMGLQLEPGAIAALEERTEGWIVGLQMAALSMRDRKDVGSFIEGFSGTQRYILDYLLEEVLLVQPPEVQQFLLCTSILERLNAPLCDAVLAGGQIQEPSAPRKAGDPILPRMASQAMLGRIEQANLFLMALDDERVWHRYHHLFADLLRARLDELYPGLSPRLHLRAAAWMAQAGMTVEAVNHTLSAGEYDGAARLVEENTTRLLAQGELNALMAWIEMLPTELRRTRPWLCVHQAYALLFAGRTSEVPSLLAEADATIPAASPHRDEGRALKGALRAAQAFTAAVMFRRVEALSYVQQARALLPPSDLFSQSLVAWAEGYALHSQGHLPEARAAFEEQIRLSRLMENSATLMIGVTALARVLADEGEFQEVRVLLEQALADACGAGAQNRGYIARVETHLAAVLCEQNEVDAAKRLLLDARSHARFWLNPNHLASIHAYLTRVLLAKGEFDEARASIAEADRLRRSAPLSEWLRRAMEIEIVRTWLTVQAAGSDILRDDALGEQARLILAAWRSQFSQPTREHDAPMSQTDEHQRLALARASLASGQIAEALRFLEPVTRSSKAASHADTAVQALVLTAVALQCEGPKSMNAALAALEEALELAERGRRVRVFINEGQPMQVLLSQWLSRAVAGRLRDYAFYLLAQLEAEVPTGAAKQKSSAAGGLIEPLTPRELEVLQLMSLGRTNPEIAQQLIVAPGTIKAHAASIYRKLDASNRTEAVARARQLGMIQ